MLDSTAELAGSAEEQVRRTTIIAFDTSDSMRKQGRIDAAKAAAKTFLDTVPDDVYVGIVTFDTDVETALTPTQDRDDARGVIDGLTLASQTRLNDGVIEAVKQAGSDGQRDILVLSDGQDTSKTPESDVTAAISEAEVGVDVVALDQSGSSLAPLEAMSEAGDGQVIPADPDALTEAFTAEAAALARQILVTATVPDGRARHRGDRDGHRSDRRRDCRCDHLRRDPRCESARGPDSAPHPTIGPMVEISRPVMYGGLGGDRPGSPGPAGRRHGLAPRRGTGLSGGPHPGVRRRRCRRRKRTAAHKSEAPPAMDQAEGRRSDACCAATAGLEAEDRSSASRHRARP